VCSAALEGDCLNSVYFIGAEDYFLLMAADNAQRFNAVARIVTVRQGNRIDSTALGSRRFSQCRGIQACYTARTLRSI
tara:strand:- start:304 stop:537 length:234 start_codon:yes stop_codon:yes gene_type:complete